MEALSRICIASAIILLVIFGIYVFTRVRAAIRTYLILKNEAGENEAIVQKLLYVNFSKKNILKKVLLPQNPDNPASPVFCIPFLIVTHGGILIISCRDFKGTIENPFNGDWRQFVSQTITQFRNPFEQNNQLIHIINAILKKEKISNVPVRSAVVYFDSKTRFKNRFEPIVHISKMVPYIMDAGKNRFLSGVEMGKTVSAIQKYRRSNRPPPQPKQGGSTGSVPRVNPNMQNADGGASARTNSDTDQNIRPARDGSVRDNSAHDGQK